MGTVCPICGDGTLIVTATRLTFTSCRHTNEIARLGSGACGSENSEKLFTP
jgi:hypothetical protein